MASIGSTQSARCSTPWENRDSRHVRGAGLHHHRL